MTAPALIGRYEVIRLLGQGGMGEVYLARDTVLGRRVALKLMPRARRNDENLRARFLREARAVAALNHPNIVTIHEVNFTKEGEAGSRAGVPYLVMELVSGQSLHSLMADRRLSLSEVMDISIQVLNGLAAAHENLVVHRDIKPSNLMLAPDARVKILDFGLSKIMTPDSLRPALTEESTVPGTVEYLSPEAALGEAVDGRSDLFSFGVVLYEMLTGIHPFGGASATERLARILTQPVRSWDEFRDVPESIRKICDRCLEKDPAARFASARDVLADLDAARRELSGEGPPPSQSMEPRPASSRKSRKRRRAVLSPKVLSWTALGIAVFSLLTGLAIWRGKKGEPPTGIFVPLRPVQVTSSPGLDMSPSFSPDSSSIAYSSDKGGSFEIFLRPLVSGGREILVTSDGKQNVQPAWSPDGKYIAYVSRESRGIWIVPALGGEPRQLSPFGSRPSWAPDSSRIVFQSDAVADLSAGAFPAVPPSTIWMIPVTGGEPVALTQPGGPLGGHGSPLFTRDGESVVFVSYVRPRSELWAVRLESKKTKLISKEQPFYFDPALSGAGDTLYFASAFPNSPTGAGVGLWKLPVDPATLEPRGKASEVLNLGLATVRYLALSHDGKRIAFSAIQTSSNLFSTAGMGSTPVQVTLGTGRCSRPAFSPDGARLAYTYWRTGLNNDIWILSKEGTDPYQLTTDPSNEDYPSWLPDGNTVAFLSSRRGHLTLWATAVQGGQEKLLADAGTGIDAARVSPDGNWIAYNSRSGGTTTNIWVARMDGTDARPLTKDLELAGFPSWSPDSQYVAFEVKRGQHNHVAIVPRQGGPMKQLTFEETLDWPFSFSPDGDRIAFARYQNGYWNVFTVSRASGKTESWTQYRRLNGYVRYPAFAPRGNRIVYEYAETTGNVWLVDVPTGKEGW